MMEVRLMVTRRFALTTSAPRLNASFTTPSNANRNSATANEPMVRTSLAFLRNRLARISLLNFMRRLRQQRLAPLLLLPAHLYRDAVWYWPGAQPLGRASPSAPFSRTP